MEWVSVKDKLPAEGKWVLAAYHDINWMTKEPYWWYEFRTFKSGEWIDDEDFLPITPEYWVEITPPTA